MSLSSHAKPYISPEQLERGLLSHLRHLFYRRDTFLHPHRRSAFALIAYRARRRDVRTTDILGIWRCPGGSCAGHHTALQANHLSAIRL